jgi:uncharacterized protein
MGALPNEPSMEEILSSIRRIIADEDRVVVRPPRRGSEPSTSPRIMALVSDSADDRSIIDSTVDVAGHDGDATVLELTDVLPAEPEREPAARPAARTPGPAEARPASRAARAEPRAESAKAETRAARQDGKSARTNAVLSESSVRAARVSLDSLSSLLVRADDGAANTLEGLVREMLRPMLKEWLDANLPQLVETMVKREIDRITGRV